LPDGYIFRQKKSPIFWLFRWEKAGDGYITGLPDGIFSNKKNHQFWDILRGAVVVIF
jgi:hypothetical protein